MPVSYSGWQVYQWLAAWDFVHHKTITMTPKSKTGIWAVLLIGLVSASQAQSRFSKWQFGIQGGVTVYMGDLTPEPAGAYKTLRPALVLYAARVLSPSFMLRGNLLLSGLRANENRYARPEWRQQRNFQFSTPVTELSGLLVWNIFKNNDNYHDRKISPYLMAGAGVGLMRVRRDASRMDPTIFGEGTDVFNGLTQDLSVAPPRAQWVLPLGAGLEWMLSPRVSLTAETNFRYTFSDYIDGFSKAANPNKKDYYYTHTLGVIVKMGNDGSSSRGGRGRTGCPAVAL
jgi:hypothetical protein